MRLVEGSSLQPAFIGENMAEKCRSEALENAIKKARVISPNIREYANHAIFEDRDGWPHTIYEERGQIISRQLPYYDMQNLLSFNREKVELSERDIDRISKLYMVYKVDEGSLFPTKRGIADYTGKILSAEIYSYAGILLSPYLISMGYNRGDSSVLSLESMKDIAFGNFVESYMIQGTYIIAAGYKPDIVFYDFKGNKLLSMTVFDSAIVEDGKIKVAHYGRGTLGFSYLYLKDGKLVRELVGV